MKSLVALALIAASAFAFAGEIAELHRNTPRASPEFTGSFSNASKIWVSYTNHGISEFGIERVAGYWGGPWGGPEFTFIVKSDGTFRYKGEVRADPSGDFTGQIDVRRFNQVARFIKESGFSELDDFYSAMVTDCPTTYTTVVMNGKRKVIRNYADGGPSELWAIEEIIDGLRAKAKWEKKKK